MNCIEKYYSGILAGKFIVGKHVRKLYYIITAGIENGVYVFDSKKANNAIKFIENYCRHSKGRNDLLKLELWQKAFVSILFGIVGKDGLRVFREVFLIIGRKNGKSLLAAGIMEYFAFVAGEYGSEIYCVATKKDQAMIVYDCLVEMINKDEELSEYVKFRKDFLRIPTRNVLIKPLPATPKSFDGLNPEVVVSDEIAAWPGENGINQYQVLVEAMGARDEPLMLAITTAGYESGGIFDDLFKRSTLFLNGDTRESQLLPILYMIDDELLWDDLDELKKANPNMGVSVKKDYFVEKIKTAEASPNAKAAFLTKFCNIKQNPTISWLPFDVIANSGCDKKIEEFKGCYAVGGFDLSLTTDLTAACVVIEKDEVLYTFAKFFMPEIKFKKDKNLYQVNEILIKQGVLKISGKNTVEHSDVVDYFNELRDEHEIQFLKIGYDRWSAREVITAMANTFGKSNLDDVWQGWNLHPIIVHLEGLIKDGKVKICNNELLKLHFRNVALYSDLNSNNKYRPVKIATNARIDGAIAVLCAMTMRSKYYNQISSLLTNDND